LSYITLRGPWCDIIVLNVHTLTEDKCDDTKLYIGSVPEVPQ